MFGSIFSVSTPNFQHATIKRRQRDKSYMKLLNNGSLFKEKPRNATVILVQLGAPQSPNHHSFQTWPKEAERDDEDFVAEAIQGDPRRF